MTVTADSAGFFVLRTPLLPVETLLDWSSGLGARAAWERGEPVAGISTGAIATETRLHIEGIDKCRRHTRLDNDCLFALVQALATDPTSREIVRYRPNDSLSCADNAHGVLEHGLCERCLDLAAERGVDNRGL